MSARSFLIATGIVQENVVETRNPLKDVMKRLWLDSGLEEVYNCPTSPKVVVHLIHLLYGRVFTKGFEVFKSNSSISETSVYERLVEDVRDGVRNMMQGDKAIREHLEKYPPVIAFANRNNIGRTLLPPSPLPEQTTSTTTLPVTATTKTSSSLWNCPVFSAMYDYRATVVGTVGLLASVGAYYYFVSRA